MARPGINFLSLLGGPVGAGAGSATTDTSGRPSASGLKPGTSASLFNVTAGGGALETVTVDAQGKATFTTVKQPGQSYVIDGTARLDAGPGQVVAPAAPTMTLSAGNGQVTIGWADGANGGSAITSHGLYRGTTSGNLQLVGFITTGSPYVDTGLTNGTPYIYQLSAKNGAGESVRTAEATATPSAITTALNWRLAITGAVTDSAGDAATQTAVQQSSANKKHAQVALALQQTRVLTIPVAAVAAPGAIVYLNTDRQDGQVYLTHTDFPGLGGSATVERSLDGGTSWSALSVAQGVRLDEGVAYSLPTGPLSLLRVTATNGNVAAAYVYLGVFQRPSAGRMQSILLQGGSFEDYGSHPRRVTNAYQAAYPALADPIVFNRGRAGWKTAQIAAQTVADMPNFPLVDFVVPNEGGNSLDPRPSVPVNGDYLNMKGDMTAMNNAVLSAGKIPLPLNISYRDGPSDAGGTPMTYDNTVPQNGSDPVNKGVVNPLIQAQTPDLFDSALGVPRCDEYSCFLFYRDTTLNPGNQHPTDGYARMNAYRAAVFGAYIYGQTPPLSIQEQAVAAFEAAKTIAAKNAAREVVLALPDSAARTAFLNRLAAFAVAVPVNTSAPSFTGTAQVGQPLVLSGGVYSNTPLGIPYTLTRPDGTVAQSGIFARRGDGTTKIYTPIAADAGLKLSLNTQAYNGEGTLSAVTSTLSATIAAATSSVPVNTAAPAFTGGQPQAGVAAPFSVGSWTNSPTGYDLTISAGGSVASTISITGTTGTYTPTAADVGKTLTIAAIAKNAAGSSASAVSAATATVLAASSTGPGTSLRPTTTNLLTTPTTFTDWTNSGPNSTVTAGQSDGLGGTTATSVVPTTTSENKRITKTVSGLTNGANYRWYVEVARVGTGPGSRYANLDWGAAASFDLANPSGGNAAIAKNGTAGTTTITDLGDGFIAIDMTAPSSSTGTVLALRLENALSATNAGFAGDGASGIKARYAHFGPVA